MSSVPPRKRMGTTMTAMMRNRNNRFLLRGVTAGERVLSFFYFFFAVIGQAYAKNRRLRKYSLFLYSGKNCRQSNRYTILNLSCFVKHIARDGSSKTKQKVKSTPRNSKNFRDLVLGIFQIPEGIVKMWKKIILSFE
jgi:hypothetical protein